MPDVNFSEQARRTLARAREEAVDLHHPYVGTEHMLLALLRESEGVASDVLKSFAVEVTTMRQVLLGNVEKGSSVHPMGTELPYTSRAKRALELGMWQSHEWAHQYIGNEHMLIGLLREKSGIAAQVLVDAGVTLDGALAQTLSLVAKPR